MQFLLAVHYLVVAISLRPCVRSAVVVGNLSGPLVVHGSEGIVPRFVIDDVHHLLLREGHAILEDVAAHRSVGSAHDAAAQHIVGFRRHLGVDIAACDGREHGSSLALRLPGDAAHIGGAGTAVGGARYLDVGVDIGDVAVVGLRHRRPRHHGRVVSVGIGEGEAVHRSLIGLAHQGLHV